MSNGNIFNGGIIGGIYYSNGVSVSCNFGKYWLYCICVLGIVVRGVFFGSGCCNVIVWLIKIGRFSDLKVNCDLCL